MIRRSLIDGRTVSCDFVGYIPRFLRAVTKVTVWQVSTGWVGVGVDVPDADVGKSVGDTVVGSVNVVVGAVEVLTALLLDGMLVTGDMPE
jgi:hypothetical protein